MCDTNPFGPISATWSFAAYAIAFDQFKGTTGYYLFKNDIASWTAYIPSLVLIVERPPGLLK